MSRTHTCQLCRILAVDLAASGCCTCAAVCKHLPADKTLLCELTGKVSAHLVQRFQAQVRSTLMDLLTCSHAQAECRAAWVKAAGPRARLRGLPSSGQQASSSTSSPASAPCMMQALSDMPRPPNHSEEQRHILLVGMTDQGQTLWSWSSTYARQKLPDCQACIQAAHV